MQTETILDKLKKEGLKITPQRIVILKALHSLKNHPKAQTYRWVQSIKHLIL